MPQGDDTAAQAEQLKAAQEMLHTRRTQLHMFCDDFVRLIEATCEHDHGNTALLNLRRDVLFQAEWVKAEHAAGYVPRDTAAAAASFDALIYHAQELSKLFTQFVKTHAHALTGKDGQVVPIKAQEHSATIARLLRSQLALFEK